MVEQDIYEEGFKSLEKNLGEYVNPYKSGTSNHNDFERGWTQAQKRASAARLKKLEELRQLKKELNKK